MKKIFFKNLYIVIASFIVFTSFIAVTSYSMADDEEEDDDDYRRPARVIQRTEDREMQTIVPSVPSPIIQTPTLTSTASSPKQIITTINKETLIKVPDNSALLAALKDSDNDGISDVIDKHPGQDDFSYYLLDNNKNGIADDLENLLK